MNKFPPLSAIMASGYLLPIFIGLLEYQLHRSTVPANIMKEVEDIVRHLLNAKSSGILVVDIIEGTRSKATFEWITDTALIFYAVNDSDFKSGLAQLSSHHPKARLPSALTRFALGKFGPADFFNHKPTGTERLAMLSPFMPSMDLSWRPPIDLWDLARSPNVPPQLLGGAIFEMPLPPLRELVTAS